MLTLIITAAVIAYLGSLYLWPYAPCRWCKGRGTNRGSTRRRFGDCRWCGGTRRRQRLGSRTVHRAVRSAVGYRSRRGDKRS